MKINQLFTTSILGRRGIGFSFSLSLLVPLVPSAIASSLTITDDNFISLGCDQNQEYKLDENDVLTISTTEATTEAFRWRLYNGYIQYNDKSFGTYGTLKLTEGATVTCDASASTGRTCVGFIELGANSNMTLNSKYVASAGPGSVKMGANSSIVLLGRNEPGDRLDAAVSSLRIGEHEDSVDSSYFRLRVAGGYEKATITNIGSEEVRLFDQPGYDIRMENVYMEVSGTHHIHVYAEITNASLLNTSMGMDFKLDNKNNKVNVINAETGNILLENQQENVLLQSLHIGLMNERGNDIKVAVTQEDGTASTVFFKTFDKTQGYNSDAAPAGLISYHNASLDANLVLAATGADGLPTKDLAIRVQIEESTGLNMLGHSVTLGTGLDLMNYNRSDHLTPNLGDTILLFTNVDSLTLSGQLYDDQYFNYETGCVAASDFFSSDYTDSTGTKILSIPELEKVESEDGHYLRGWFVEYNQGTDPSLGNVSLVYQQLRIPEPTTATLSLLALAGLALRRRR